MIKNHAILLPLIGIILTSSTPNLTAMLPQSNPDDATIYFPQTSEIESPIPEDRFVALGQDGRPCIHNLANRVAGVRARRSVSYAQEGETEEHSHSAIIAHTMESFANSMSTWTNHNIERQDKIIEAQERMNKEHQRQNVLTEQRLMGEIQGSKDTQCRFIITSLVSICLGAGSMALSIYNVTK